MPDGSEAFGGFGLDVDGAFREMREPRDAARDFLLSFAKFRFLRHDGDVDVLNRPTPAKFVERAIQELLAGRPLPARIGVRKAIPDVARPGRPQERVHDGMQHDVAVGMPLESARVIDGDAAEKEAPTGDQLVDVEPESDRHVSGDYTMVMSLLLLCSLALQGSAELDETIAIERRKMAITLEEMRAWGWARLEYRKLLRLAPKDEVAQRKLVGTEAIALTNEKTTPELVSKYVSMLAEIARIAADGHAALAKSGDDAERHWRLALLYAPAREDALAALKFAGGSDPIWKDVRWKDLLAKADSGTPVDEKSDLETKWSIKTTKRDAPSLAWEGVDVEQDHLRRLARQAEASASLLRIALGDAELKPCVKRIVVMTGKAPYSRYIDDFVVADDAVKKLLKKTGGLQNIQRDEFVEFAFDKGSDWHDHNIAHAVGEFVLASALGKRDYDDMPAWLKEGVGCLCDILFRGSVKASCVEVPTGTGAGDVPWTDSTRWDENLKGLVAKGRDPELTDVFAVTLNAMKGDHRAKAASVVRMLILRWPAGFRAIVAGVRKEGAMSRGAFEAALGITIEELDEFWRRWLRGA